MCLRSPAKAKKMAKQWRDYKRRTPWRSKLNYRNLDKENRMDSMTKCLIYRMHLTSNRPKCLVTNNVNTKANQQSSPIEISDTVIPIRNMWRRCAKEETGKEKEIEKTVELINKNWIWQHISRISNCLWDCKETKTFHDLPNDTDMQRCQHKTTAATDSHITHYSGRHHTAWRRNTSNTVLHHPL